ncbi:carbohydrate ABC transporter permease [Paenibacillus thalictri]|uniref:carbohydrate ABC transporter permease n=1 Tax=Paenibacillus thalictri TaxID=2527873 RepID=UPI001F102A63|nr:carbohydrate ABC transporter permease [Paenibacillus thalictri]
MRLTKIAITVVMLALGITMIFPYLWMISTSIKRPDEVFIYPVQLIPKVPVLEHHITVWTGKDSFLPYYLNSLKVAFLSMGGAVLLSAFAAYGFARIEFKGRDSLFFLYLTAMMIPPQILFVPKFIMFDWAGIYNTHWALILPGWFTIFGVFMIRQFLLGIPKDLTEAAMMDGAGHIKIFFRLMLPLIKPALATLAIIDFSWHWNDYENALVFLLDKNLYTVPLGLQNFIDENYVDYNKMMAAASAAMIPMIVLFFIGQKYIIQSVTSTSVKG